MPSTSPKQAKLMMIAAHTKGGYGGVPQKVGKEFYKADTGKSIKKEDTGIEQHMHTGHGKTLKEEGK